jgi:hypothetical protein
MAKHHRIGGAEKKPPRISYMSDTSPIHHLTVPETMTIEEEDGLLQSNAKYLKPSVHIVDFNDEMQTPEITYHVRRKPPRRMASPICTPLTDVTMLNSSGEFFLQRIRKRKLDLEK